MEKTAQKRGLLDKVRENIDLGGIAAEKVPFLNPGFQEVMEKLRTADDVVRSIALGTSVGDQGIDPEDKVSLKDLLKEAESALNRRAYMKASAFLSRFHNKMDDIVQAFKTFEVDLTAIHEKFLLEDIDEDIKDQILKQRKRLQGKKASLKSDLIKEAGIGDVLYNLMHETGRAMAAWEKRYPAKSKAFKNATSNILKLSKSLFEKVLKHFDGMSTARAKRLIEKYEAHTNEIKKLVNAYDVNFRKYYDEHVKFWADKLSEKVETVKEESATVPSIKELEIKHPVITPENNPISSIHEKQSIAPGESAHSLKENVPSALAPTLVDAPKIQTFYSPGPTSTQTPGPIPKSPKLPDIKMPSLQSGPATEPSPPPEPEISSSERITSQPPPFQGLFGPKTVTTGLAPSHAKEIIKNLEALSNESPIILKKYLTKYASILNKSNPKSAKILLDIANRIEV